MALPAELNAVAHGIQLAVAPVFLLTAVSGLIGAAAGRLARIIDRARIVEARIASEPAAEAQQLAWRELAELRTRGLLANGAIALLTLCAVMIGLFLGETTELQILRIAAVGFLGGVACFIFALACFLAETVIATRLLNFARPPRL